MLLAFVRSEKVSFLGKMLRVPKTKDGFFKLLKEALFFISTLSFGSDE